MSLKKISTGKFLGQPNILYISRDFVGELKECDEGELKWIPKDEILKLNLWQGDILFLKRLLKDESYFEMKLTYIKDDLKDWSYL